MITRSRRGLRFLQSRSFLYIVRFVSLGPRSTSLPLSLASRAARRVNYSPQDNNNREDAFYSLCAPSPSARNLSRPGFQTATYNIVRPIGRRDVRGSAQVAQRIHTCVQCSLVNDRRSSHRWGALIVVSIMSRIMREVIYEGTFCANIDCKGQGKRR